MWCSSISIFSTTLTLSFIKWVHFSVIDFSYKCRKIITDFPLFFRKDIWPRPFTSNSLILIGLVC
jgi:hypothetical protein